MAVIEVTAGEQACEIDALLRNLGGRSIECWLDGRWSGAPLSEIPRRTDVRVRFA